MPSSGLLSKASRILITYDLDARSDLTQWLKKEKRSLSESEAVFLSWMRQT